MLIALLGIVNTLALSVFERTRELGLLRAVGMTRGQVRAMVRWESAVISLIGAVSGAALGIGIGLALSQVLKDEGIKAISIPVGPDRRVRRPRGGGRRPGRHRPGPLRGQGGRAEGGGHRLTGSMEGEGPRASGALLHARVLSRLRRRVSRRPDPTALRCRRASAYDVRARVSVYVDGTLLAELAHDGLGMAEVRPRHAREEVVLDLVVEAAERHVHEGATAHVPRGQHLAQERVRGLLGTQDRHALVTGREGAAQVDPERGLVHRREDERLRPGEGPRQEGDVRDEVDGEEHPLDRAVP